MGAVFSRRLSEGGAKAAVEEFQFGETVVQSDFGQGLGGVGQIVDRMLEPDTGEIFVKAGSGVNFKECGEIGSVVPGKFCQIVQGDFFGVVEMQILGDPVGPGGGPFQLGGAKDGGAGKIPAETCGQKLEPALGAEAGKRIVQGQFGDDPGGTAAEPAGLRERLSLRGHTGGKGRALSGFHGGGERKSRKTEDQCAGPGLLCAGGVGAAWIDQQQISRGKIPNFFPAVDDRPALEQQKQLVFLAVSVVAEIQHLVNVCLGQHSPVRRGQFQGKSHGADPFCKIFEEEESEFFPGANF